MHDDAELPHDIYMSLHTDMKLSRIASLFASRGWDSRMCSWTEYELTTDGSELVLMPAQTTLLSGGISSDHRAVERIFAILDSAGIEYSYEIYDENKAILQSKEPPASCR